LVSDFSGEPAPGILQFSFNLHFTEKNKRTKESKLVTLIIIYVPMYVQWVLQHANIKIKNMN